MLADGSVAHASETENPELFWAMRGAGANFGVAVSFEFAADRVGRVAFAQFVYDASDTAGFLSRWGAAIEAADRSVLTSRFCLSGTSVRGDYRSVWPVGCQPGERPGRAVLIAASRRSRLAILSGFQIGLKRVADMANSIVRDLLEAIQEMRNAQRRLAVISSI